jgi:hypothetical protein
MRELKDFKIKLITGYREEQNYIIDAEEAHKAYYLFMHPNERGIFSNGVAVIGADIKGIVPAWNETMGWNPTHKLDSDDWNDIRSKGIEAPMHDALSDAKHLLQFMEKDKNLLSKPMSQVIALAEKNLLN